MRDSPRTSAWLRLTLTAALSLVPVVGSLVPIPGMSSLPANGGRTVNISLFEPGVGALLSGYVMVELAALLVPRLRRLRHAFPDGRARLRPWVYVTTLLFAAFQALGLSKVLRELTQSYGGHVSTPLVVVSVTAATGVLVLVARAIDGLGLVNGVIAVSLASECASVPRHFARALLPGDPSAVAIASALYLLPVVATWAAVRRFQQPMKDAGPSLGGPLSSLRPVLASGSLLAFPASLRAFHVPGADAWAAWIPGPHYDALLLGVGLTLTLLLSWLLQLPPRVAGVLNAVEPRDAPFTTTDVQHAWRRGLVSTILLVLTVLFAGALLKGRQFPDYAFASALLTTLLMDGRQAFKLHATTPGLVCVWEERRPYAVPGLIAAARRAGISLHSSGTAQTGVVRLFGPYAAISLWTAAAEAEAARALLGELLQQANRPALLTPEPTTMSSATTSTKKPITFDRYTITQVACFLVVAGVAVVSHAPRTTPPLAAEPTPTVRADVELVLVDDAVDPLADQVEPQLPTGVARFTEDLRFMPGRHHYARLVLQPGEDFARARSRLEPWLATLPLPRDERFAWEEQATGTYRSYVLSGSAVFTGPDLQSVAVIRGADDLSAVGVTLYSGAAEVFRRFTRAHQHERMALVVNHRVIMAPQITGEIFGGTMQINCGGNDPDSTRQSAEALLKELTTPAPN